MPQYVFGTGNLYTTPVGGGAPFKFGALQDVSVDFSADIKTLHGQFQFPLSVARGKAKIEGKAATGEVDVNSFNTFYFGQEVVDGSELIQAINEPGTIPATPYEITVTHAADFTMDLGVVHADTGVPYKQVPSGTPATGEYKVSIAGVYTFAAADTTLDVLISYLWESATGASLEIGNPLMGSTPRFQMVLSQIFEGKTFTMLLYSCVAAKMSLPLKQDDYLISDLDFQAQTNDANKVGRMTTTATAG